MVAGLSKKAEDSRLYRVHPAVDTFTLTILWHGTIHRVSQCLGITFHEARRLLHVFQHIARLKPQRSLRRHKKSHQYRSGKAEHTMAAIATYPLRKG